MYIVFFKQKTAYDMRISDWSSDVCSSDLDELHLQPAEHLGLLEHLRLQVGGAVPGGFAAGGGVHGEDQPAALVAAGRTGRGGVRQLAQERIDLRRRGLREFGILRHPPCIAAVRVPYNLGPRDRKSTRLNSSH